MVQHTLTYRNIQTGITTTSATTTASWNSSWIQFPFQHVSIPLYLKKVEEKIEEKKGGDMELRSVSVERLCASCLSIALKVVREGRMLLHDRVYADGSFKASDVCKGCKKSAEISKREMVISALVKRKIPKESLMGLYDFSLSPSDSEEDIISFIFSSFSHPFSIPYKEELSSLSDRMDVVNTKYNVSSPPFINSYSSGDRKKEEMGIEWRSWFHKLSLSLCSSSLPLQKTISFIRREVIPKRLKIFSHIYHPQKEAQNARISHSREGTNM